MRSTIEVAHRRHRVTQVGLVVGVLLVEALEFEHWLQSRVGAVAFGALRFKTHPQFEALDVAEVFADWKLFKPVSFFVVAKANEAANDAEVHERVSVGDYSHLDEMRRVHSLLNHVENAIFAEYAHSGLVAADLFLDII